MEKEIQDLIDELYELKATLAREGQSCKSKGLNHQEAYHTGQADGIQTTLNKLYLLKGNSVMREFKYVSTIKDNKGK